MENICHMDAFKGCYVMQREDIGCFASTLADGFSKYDLFKYICNGRYSHKKMYSFWFLTIALLGEEAICIADSKDANSVLIYVRPGNNEEPGVFEYLKSGGFKMLYDLGLRSSLRLLRFKFDAHVDKAVKRYKKENCGYILAYATRLDKQGQNYGKPLMQALLNYLDESGEDCYLETYRERNVGLYNHFSFELMEQAPLNYGGLTLYALKRHVKQRKDI